jgi:hypothetical protein
MNHFAGRRGRRFHGRVHCEQGGVRLATRPKVRRMPAASGDHCLHTRDLQGCSQGTTQNVSDMLP